MEVYMNEIPFEKQLTKILRSNSHNQTFMRHTPPFLLIELKIEK